MIYFGDGTTDIPCMRLVKSSGGYSIAVYDPFVEGERAKSERLIDENRVNFVSPADYSEGKELDNIVKTIIDKIDADHQLSKLMNR
jgi:hypothetical protein